MNYEQIESDQTLPTRGKIIWAIDSVKNPEQSWNLIQELNTWSQLLNCDVQPTFIFSETNLGYPPALGLPWQDRYREVAERLSKHFLSAAKVNNQVDAKIIFEPSASNQEMAEKVALYASRCRATMIFSGFHHQQTWNPFRIDGVAEPLMSLSRVPLLLMNQDALPSRQQISVLFPTDFSRRSKVSLYHLIPLAKKVKAKVILFNQVELPKIYPLGFSQSAAQNLESMDSMLKDLELVSEQNVKIWENLVKENNLACQSQVTREHHSLASEILSACHQNGANLIALSNHRGPISQIIAGGLARELVMRAPCPVLIFAKPKNVQNPKISNLGTIAEIIQNSFAPTNNPSAF